MGKYQIKDAKGKLGVLVVGMNGAVASTFITGVLSIRKGLAKPIGSVSQMQTIRIGKRIDNNFPLIKDFVPLANLDDMVFGGWDIEDKDMYEATSGNGVLSEKDVNAVKEDLQKLHCMPAVFEQRYVQKLHGDFVKKADSKLDYANQVREDIRKFKEEKGVDRVVMIWCGSTEVYMQMSDVHQTVEAFEKGLAENHAGISPSMIYAYAGLMEGVPYVNGAPNLTVDMPAMMELADRTKLPISGKDFKTGQTLIKTVISPMLKARMIGLSGWFSTNILGNRDGEVLDDPESFKTKEQSKLSVIDSIIQPELYPDLYKDYYHKVRINYYPPKGDNKEGWDQIDIFGWMGYPMELKINFLCRDSILAAPIALDLVLFTDLAMRAGMHGIQEWLSFYLKSPMHRPNVVPENDLFIQLIKLKNTLRLMMGEEVVTHVEEQADEI